MGGTGYFNEIHFVCAKMFRRGLFRRDIRRNSLSSKSSKSSKRIPPQQEAKLDYIYRKQKEKERQEDVGCATTIMGLIAWVRNQAQAHPLHCHI